MAWQKYESNYVPGQTAAYKISRSKIEMFISCKRCFWLEKRMGIKQPSTPPFTINSAIDSLLKKEFDEYRKMQKPHPYMVDAKINAVPFRHKDLDKWRHNFTGVQALHEPTNILVFGAVDDVWVGPNGELIVVDYKATAKNKVISDLDPPGGWHDAYRRQMEIYQWLLRSNGFEVSNTGYFVYANADVNQAKFGNELKFDVRTFPYEGSSDWVESTLIKMKEVLEGDIPEVGRTMLGGICEHCNYAKLRTEMTIKAIQQKNK